MNAQEFEEGIKKIVAKSGENVTVSFHHDEDEGKLIGIASNGYMFVGNSTSLKIALYEPQHDARQFIMSEVLDRLDAA